jgi:hypothetical protein
MKAQQTSKAAQSLSLAVAMIPGVYAIYRIVKASRDSRSRYS